MATQEEINETQLQILKDNQAILNQQLVMLEEIYGIARFWYWLTWIALIVPAVIFIVGVLFKVSIFAWFIGQLMR